MRTLEQIEADLAAAEAKREALEAARRRGDGYDNPKRQRRAEEAAWTEVHNLRVERDRCITGWTPPPVERLDAAFPNAKSKRVVEFEGRFFRIDYQPVTKSRSGKTVKEWAHTWTEANGPATS